MPSLTDESSLLATLKERLSLPDGQVEKDLIQGGEEGLNEATLRRWLRADKCAQLFGAQIKHLLDLMS